MTSLMILEKLVYEMACDAYTQSPEEVYDKIELARLVQEKIESLPERYQRAFKLRFGMEGNKARTLKEVGVELDVTPERVRQMLSKVYHALMQNKKRAKLIRSVVGLPEPKEPPVIEYNHPDPRVRVLAAHMALYGRRR